MTADNRPRPAPAKPRPPRPRVLEPDAIEDPDDFAPLEITTGSRKKGRRVVIFYIDGEAHSVPENPPATVLLTYLDQVRRHGAVASSTYLLEAMLGAESYAALLGSEDITQEQLKQVIEKIDGIVMAAERSPKAGS